MKNSILKWQIIGVAFIFIIGTLFHFLYDWSGGTKIVGFISPINESVWEHLKLILYPSLIFALIEYKSIKNTANNFIIAVTASIMISMILIVVLFYGYTAVLGHNLLIIDILIFLVSIIIGQYIGYKILTMPPLPQPIFTIAILLLILIVVSFIVFSINPPHLPIFMDPQTGKYGP